MSFSTDLRTYLLTIPDITSLVGAGTLARIRPSRLEQGDSFPAIRYAIPSGESHSHLGGGLGVRQPSLQIDCYGNSRNEAEELGEAVRVALHTYHGMMNATYVHSITMTNRFELYEPASDASDTGAHREVLTFNVVHDEAIPAF